jgi:calcineurin-like phosphoesterase
VRERKYFFDDPFTRVTGLICQIRRGNANFFFFDFMAEATD